MKRKKLNRALILDCSSQLLGQLVPEPELANLHSRAGLAMLQQREQPAAEDRY